MFQRELAFAHDVADRAAGVGLGFFHGGFEVMTKPDSTPVTEADLAIEAMVRERIAHEFQATTSSARSRAARTRVAAPGSWIRSTPRRIRPGDPDLGTLLALRVEGDLKVAVVSPPRSGSATPRCGARGPN